MFRSDQSFFEYLKKNKRAVAIILPLAAFLLVLCLIPTGGGEESEEDDEQTRLAAVVSQVSGVGDCEVMISYADGGEVYGVIVLCDGAERVAVRERLYDLLSSLYGIGANRISILKIKE